MNDKSIVEDSVQQPLALVDGQSLIRKLPDDLYIPPDALEVILDAFEGAVRLIVVFNKTSEY